MKKSLVYLSLFLLAIGCNDSLEFSEDKDNSTPNTTARTNSTSSTTSGTYNTGTAYPYYTGYYDVVYSGLEETDKSGKIHTKRFWLHTAAGSHRSATVQIDPEYVIVGGTARAVPTRPCINSTCTYYYGLLTESRPDFTNNSWIASSKDHNVSGPHYLFVEAIGLRIDGMTSAELRSYMKEFSYTGSVASHPISNASLISGYQLIGGGGKINWTGNGNLLTRSDPVGNIWAVAGKDHQVSSPASATAYAIGITTGYIPGLNGYIERAHDYENPINGSGVMRFSGGSVPFYDWVDGWIETSYGAKSLYSNGGGRLLFQIGDQSESKDHQVSSYGSLTRTTTFIRFKP